MAAAVALAVSGCGGSGGSAGPGSGAGAGSVGSSGGGKGPAATAPPSGPVTTALAPWSLPAPTSRAVVLADGGHLLVLGGLTTGDVSTSSVSELDPETGAVSGVGRLGSAVHDAAGALIGGRAYVFGGGAASTVATVQAWDPAAGGTAARAGALPQARSDVAAVTVGSTTYVLGGFDGSALTGSILATTDGTSFRPVGALAQPVRYPAVATDAQGRVWVFGGELGSSESAAAGGQTDAIQRFDPATGTTSVVGHLPQALGHASAFSLGGRMFVAGGRSAGSPLTSVWQVDAARASVSAAGTLPGPRSDAAAAVIGATAYLVGGERSGPVDPLSSVVEVKA